MWFVTPTTEVERLCSSVAECSLSMNESILFTSQRGKKNIKIKKTKLGVRWVGGKGTVMDVSE